MNPFENPFSETKAEDYQREKEVEMNFGGSEDLPKWCRLQEFFGEGKVIEIVKFQRLSAEAGETKTKFLDKEGKTYRLTFIDHSIQEPKERYYENQRENFRTDIVMSTIRAFGDTKIPSGVKVRLACITGERPGMNGMMKTYRWVISKVEQTIRLDD